MDMHLHIEPNTDPTSRWDLSSEHRQPAVGRAYIDPNVVKGNLHPILFNFLTIGIGLIERKSASLSNNPQNPIPHQGPGRSAEQVRVIVSKRGSFEDEAKRETAKKGSQPLASEHTQNSAATMQEASRSPLQPDEMKLHLIVRITSSGPSPEYAKSNISKNPIPSFCVGGLIRREH
ncbi:uncharacterized protein EI90DRAFT_3128623 [Cantharellus anzutake]|uniref:uncharacterized protein n=1 Tax=Cantharellus anzutake TaxID=1750568 RepID=UPI001907A687|nr:uncharacterized protein EI90DRAFT_3128623 [Cantharellus anzutake]KAF8325559.1 hypothetical protein EI90DRAFT_3128623 [Cantharellus anzutake]